MLLNQEQKPSTLVGLINTADDMDFSEKLKTVHESFKRTHNVDLLQHRDFEDVLRYDTMFENYRTDLLGDVIDTTVAESFAGIGAAQSSEYFAQHSAKFAQMVDNVRNELVTEAANAGQLAPVVSLTFPLLKKAYIKTAYKDVIQTVVSSGPAVKIGMEREFMKNRAGEKFYTPDIFYPENEDKLMELRGQMMGTAIPTDLYPKTGTLPIHELNMLTEAGGSLQNRDSLSNDFCISAVTIKVPTDTTPVEVEVKGLDIRPRLETGTFSKRITAKSQKTGDTTEVVDILSGVVDFYQGKVSISSTAGLITKVRFGGHLSSQYNNNTFVETDRERFTQEYTIAEQERLNTGFTAEQIRSSKVLANIDVAASAVSSMSDNCAQLKDSYSKKWLQDSFTNATANTGRSAIAKQFGYDLALTQNVEFPLTPPVEYNLPESEWRTKQLRWYMDRLLSYMVQRIKFCEMMLVMVANPFNISMIEEDIKWVVDDNTKIGGIKLDYRFGIMSVGGKRVMVVSSQKESIEKGFRILCYPLTEEVITHRMYDYTFFIENNYRNPNTPNVPNVMVAQSYLLMEIVPLQAEFAFKEYKSGIYGFEPKYQVQAVK